MKTQGKWNKELIYAITFLIAAIMWYFLNPVGIARNLIELSPNALNIKYTLFDLGLFPILYHVLDISIIGLLFFLLCSTYAGTISIRKSSPDDERKIFGFIPKNAPGFMAILMVFSSSAYFVINVLVATDLLN